MRILFPVRGILPTMALVLIGLVSSPLQAQQTDPALEVYALIGGYASPREWSGQYGGGLLAPLGNK